MQIKFSEINGIFQAYNHTSFSKILWTVLVFASLSIIIFNAWGGEIDLFGFSQNVTSEYLKISIGVLVFYGLPVIAMLVGLAKIIKKPGVYAEGVRIVENGVEIGTFSIRSNSLSYGKVYPDTLMSDTVSGDWKSQKISNGEAINILIVLRKEQEESKRFLLEQVDLFSGGNRLIKLVGHKPLGKKGDIFVAISKGRLSLLGSSEGIYPEELLSFRQLISDIVSGWQPSFALSCTLQILPSFASLDNIASIGVLGGLNNTSSTPLDHNGSKEIIFNSKGKPPVDFNRD